MLDDYKEEQPTVYQILKNTVIKEKQSHAYLFETNGYSKQFDVALAFAKYLLCEKHHMKKEDALECSTCQRIQDGNFTELKIIEPEGLWIKKEQLSKLQEEFSKKAVESTKKVYIIHHAERLNASSANSILKFLEEPEENIVAILLVDNLYQLLDTIVSRCQVISFKKEKVDKGASTLSLIGNILTDNEEDFRTYLEDEKKKEMIDQVVKFICYYETNGKDALLYSEKLWFEFIKEKEDYLSAFLIMELFYKDILNTLLSRPLKVMQDYKKEIDLVTKKNTVSTVNQKLSKILFHEKKIRINANTHLLMDKLILDLTEVVE